MTFEIPPSVGGFKNDNLAKNSLFINQTLYLSYH